MNIEQRLLQIEMREEELRKRENLILVENNENLRRPESIQNSNITHKMIQPTHDGKLYVQVSRIFRF